MIAVICYFIKYFFKEYFKIPLYLYEVTFNVKQTLNASN